MFFRNAKTFLAWIERNDADDLDLLDWCHHGFGRGREAEPPHVELAAALPPGGDNYTLRRELARRLRRILERWPDLRIPYPGVPAAPAAVLYELLSFAAMLHCGEELFEALWAVRQRLAEEDAKPAVEVQIGLTKALTHNQVKHHAGLQAVWRAMIAGTPDRVLGGTPEIGFEGAAMMPSASEAGRPDRAAVGEGLLALAQRYQLDRENRWGRFREWVFWLRGLWGLENNGAFFILLAHEFQWAEKGQAWAVQALPDLMAQDYGASTSTGRVRAHVWHWFARCLDPLLKDQPYWKPRLFCGGEVWFVEYPEKFSRVYDLALARLRQAAESKRTSEAELIEQHLATAIQDVEKAVKLWGGQGTPEFAAITRLRAEFLDFKSRNLFSR